MADIAPKLCRTLMLARDLPEQQQDELAEAVAQYIAKHILPVIR